MATKTGMSVKPSRKQQQQIEQQNNLIEELLIKIEQEKSKGKKKGFKVFIGFDVLVVDTDLEVLNEKLEKQNFVAQNDSVPVDDHQGHLGRYVHFLLIKKIK